MSQRIGFFVGATYGICNVDVQRLRLSPPLGVLDMVLGDQACIIAKMLRPVLYTAQLEHRAPTTLDR